jgi:hypothetical protein
LQKVDNRCSNGFQFTGAYFSLRHPGMVTGGLLSFDSLNANDIRRLVDAYNATLVQACYRLSIDLTSIASLD